MELFIKIVQVILSLGLLIFIHELGHFIPAKLFRTRVEKFYLFFDPWFSLLKFKKGETEYGIGWIPFGGYCKISGMIDESMDKEQMKLPPQPWEFRSKPAWQRLIIIVGGVAFNLIFAVLIYVLLVFFTGEKHIQNKSLKYGIACDSLAMSFGLQNGDKVISADNVEIENFEDISKRILFANSSIQVERNNQKIDIPIKKEAKENMMGIKKDQAFILPRVLFYVEAFSDSSVAKMAGLKKDDQIIGINNFRTIYFDEVRAQLQKLKNKDIELIALRGKDTMKFKLKLPANGLLGIMSNTNKDYFKYSTKTYSLFGAIPVGTVKAYEMLSDNLSSLKLLFSSKKAYKHVSSVVSITTLFSPIWDWELFWRLTAFLFVAIGVINIFPIPALDGGHAVFILYEMITRRKPSEKVMEYAQIVGFAILLLVFVLTIGNDIIKNL